MSDVSFNQAPVFKVVCAFFLSLVIFISVIDTMYIVALVSGIICLVFGIILGVLLYVEFYKLKHS